MSFLFYDKAFSYVKIYLDIQTVHAKMEVIMNEQEQNNTQPTPTNRFKKPFIGVFILLLLTFGVNIAQAFHLLDDDNPTMTIISVEDINKSNELFSAENFSADKYTEFVEKEIKTKANWEKDPNAVYMDYLAQSFQLNKSGMKSAFEKLSKMNELGYFVDGRFFPLKNLELMQNEIESSEHGTNESEAKG